MMVMKKGVIFNIQRFCTDDGPGIRTTVFLKGCNLRCAWCHNPEGQSAEREWMQEPDRCVGCGRCAEVTVEDTEFVCFHGAKTLCGKNYTADEILREVQKDALFYRNSGGGVTFSGGECMLQADFLEEILKKCKENGIHTAIETAGHVPYSAFERILPYVDLILYDVKCLDAETHKRYIGVGNELILQNLQKLLSLGKAIWVRIPIIPGVNDTEDEMRNIRRFLEACGMPERVELLPYHAFGEHKYAAVGREFVRFETPGKSEMDRLKRIFI